MIPSPGTRRALLTDITAKAGIRFRHTNGAFGKKLLPETMGSRRRLPRLRQRRQAGPPVRQLLLLARPGKRPAQPDARPLSQRGQRHVQGRDPGQRPGRDDVRHGRHGRRLRQRRLARRLRHRRRRQPPVSQRKRRQGRQALRRRDGHGRRRRPGRLAVRRQRRLPPDEGRRSPSPAPPPSSTTTATASSTCSCATTCSGRRPST